MRAGAETATRVARAPAPMPPKCLPNSSRLVLGRQLLGVVDHVSSSSCWSISCTMPMTCEHTKPTHRKQHGESSARARLSIPRCEHAGRMCSRLWQQRRRLRVLQAGSAGLASRGPNLLRFRASDPSTLRGSPASAGERARSPQAARIQRRHAGDRLRGGAHAGGAHSRPG